MTTYLATHGFGAIKDSNSTFTITTVTKTGSAVIKPTDPNELSGWIHYTIQSPSADQPNLKTAIVDFSSQSATIETVEIHMAQKNAFVADNLQATQAITLPITGYAGAVTFNGKGLALSVYIVFSSLSSSISLQSVSITTA
ncbi:hypothetical protein QBC35DRAFT_507317 [Podospora australis]|uniref:Uncharacterized protein n=1 Tax=Podospora australis TaxID=1536484 RepID=A0AAN6WLF4_9PEZI|nr:hypothetical protein QBC35DRAFT_507317 [Podospora australis]